MNKFKTYRVFLNSKNDSIMSGNFNDSIHNIRLNGFIKRGQLLIESFQVKSNSNALGDMPDDYAKIFIPNINQSNTYDTKTKNISTLISTVLISPDTLDNTRLSFSRDLSTSSVGVSINNLNLNQMSLNISIRRGDDSFFGGPVPNPFITSGSYWTMVLVFIDYEPEIN